MILELSTQLDKKDGPVFVALIDKWLIDFIVVSKGYVWPAIVRIWLILEMRV